MPNPKGSNGGGGMRKGQKTRRTLEREEREAALRGQQRAAQQAATGGGKLAEDVLSEAMNYFFGLAAHYQPAETNTHRDEKKFEGYLLKAVNVAGKLQPYQMRRLPPQEIVSVPLDLTKLNNQELDELERLHAKAAVTGGDQGGAPAKVH